MKVRHILRCTWYMDHVQWWSTQVQYSSDGVLKYITRVPFFEYSYSEPQVLGWYSYSKVNVLGQKKSRVHEYIWPSLKVINKINIW